MAGITGPIPKRSDERIRRNKSDTPVTKVTHIGVVPIPELNLGNITIFEDGTYPVHPMVEDIYESLRESAQSKWYEPSDWQHARLALYFVNRLLWSPRPSAEMLATVNSMLSSLLMTEGDRRRVRMEIERKPAGESGSEDDTVSDMFKKRLGAN